ncbi:MAG: hypothetical protein JXQ73_29655 [Phycisphaerae bacterium]|nr:hypothetical protein [Phycisphaerae bacterium]
MSKMTFAGFLLSVFHLIVPVTAATVGGEGAPVGFEALRHVYERGETVALVLRAAGGERVEFDVSGWLPAAVDVVDGAATYTARTDLLRAGDYTVRARLIKGGKPARTVTFPLSVAPRHDAERLSVWRWGGGGSDVEWWARRGFTGGFIVALRDPADATDGERVAQIRRQYDEATRHDFELGPYLHPLLSERAKADASILCVGADGKPYEGSRRKICPLEPKFVAQAKGVVDSWVKLLSEYPSMRHVMFSSEYQTPFCFNAAVVELAKKETGLDVRKFLTEKGGLKGIGSKDVKEGLIDDDNGRYRFLQWWWQRGHGTAALHEALAPIAKKHRPDAITWHEPYRLAPVRFSHKGLDCIGTWTYGHPDIKRLCYTTYLQAAGRSENQLVHQDITLFVYGRMAVRLDKATADLSQDFAGKDPYFTAGCDYAKEAMWIVLSQRPDILCFYSAGKLAPTNTTLDPTISSPETFDAIGRTCDVLVRPYGPAILASRRVPARVAVLMSAAATWFRVGPWVSGYDNEKTLPYATLLMMNHVPFEVLLDEDIVEGALDRYDVLVMPLADTLTRSMHAKIVAFAERGGTVIADDGLRASIPNVKRTAFDFTYLNRRNGEALAKGNAVTAEEGREIREGYARQLAPLLAKAPRPADSASLRVLTNSLQGGDVAYHFFVNDDRTYGPRFGEWKLRFETCRRQTAQVSVAAPAGAVLYDTLRRRLIEAKREGDRATFELSLPGAWGALVAVVPEAIESVKVEGPGRLEPGEPVSLTIRVIGKSGKAVGGVCPLRVEVLDPLGRESEWCRYTTTREGVCSFSFVPAINDAVGTWTVRVTDLIAGRVAEVELALLGGS